MAENITDRKLRLFAAACCRSIWYQLTDARSRTAVTVAEQHADGQADERALAVAYAAAREVRKAGLKPEERSFAKACRWVARPSALEAAEKASEFVDDGESFRKYAQFPQPDDGLRVQMCVQAVLLRDIFGNPFRPVAAKPAWLTEWVVAVARKMYESRNFSEMKTLAEALVKAGCDHPEILTHCHRNGPHVRGCWVVDLLLGQK